MFDVRDKFRDYFVIFVHDGIVFTLYMFYKFRESRFMNKMFAICSQQECIMYSRYLTKLMFWLILTGQLLLAKGEVEQASAAFKIVLDGVRDNVPALLGQV